MAANDAEVDAAGAPRSTAWTSLAALLLLVAQPVVFFRHVLINPTRHIPFDIQAFHLPLIAYIARCAREGVLPLWDPYPYTGVPIHADLQAQLFYPVTWISILVSNLSHGHRLFYWVEWLNPLHMMLAGLFTFVLARRMGAGAPVALFAGTVYQLGGYFASQAEHLGAISCGAWLPLVLLCIWELSQASTLRWMAILAMATALSILAGFAATALIVFGVAALATVLLALARRNGKLILSVAAAMALGGCVTAIQIFPTYQLAGLSKASNRAQAFGKGNGLRPESLASLALPNFYHIFTPFDRTRFKLGIEFTALYVYCGTLTLLLLLAAPFLPRAGPARILFLLTVVMAVWMLGESTPVYRIVFTHLPYFLRASLYAGYALMAFSLFAALTAAFALKRIAAWIPPALVWAVALATSVDLTYAGSDRPMNALPPSYKQEISEFGFGSDTATLRRIQEMVGRTTPPLRLDYLRQDIFVGVKGSEQVQLPTAGGDNPFVLQRILDLRRLFCGGQWWERDLPVNRPNSPLLDMLNIGYLVDYPDPPALPELRQRPFEAELAGVRFYRNANPLPRFFLAAKLQISHSAAETFAELARPDFKPADETIVETQDLPAGPLPGRGAVQVIRYEADQVELRVNATGRAFLATSEAFYPGWQATVNGKNVPFYMTNGAFRGLSLNAGSNRVVMTYRPDLLAPAVISGLSVLLVLGGVIFGGRKQKQAA